MLKNLKKKDDKKQGKKESNKEKAPKNEAKKPKEEQEEQTNTNLVEIDFNEKETAVKTVKKVAASKLQEKQIDTSNIVMEKKEEKKVITSWVVNEADIKKILQKDFNALEHETEFESLTDDSINKKLQEKAKKEAEQNKPKIVEVGGLKLAPLQNNEKGREQDFVFSKRQDAPLLGSIPVNIPTFVNTGGAGTVNFAPIQKTAQQLKEEELQLKFQQKEQEVVVKAKGGWLGSKANEPKPPQPDFKVSAWAALADQVTGQQPVNNFVPLQKSTQDAKLQGYGKKEQEFKFTNKKEVEARRKAREEAALVQK